MMVVKDPTRRKKAKAKLGSRQRRLLSETVQIEDELIPLYTRPILFIVATMLVSFIAWASITELAEVTSAPGEIIPSGQIKVVQHLDGGVVSEINVRERMLVKAGDVLLKVDGGQAKSDLRQMEVRLASLQMRSERQAAFISGREPDFSAYQENYLSLVALQAQNYRNQIQSRDSTLEILSSQISQREERLDQLQKSLESAEEEKKLTSEMLSLRQKLADKKLIKRIVLLETRRSAVTASGEVERITKEIELVNQELEETRSRYLDTNNQLFRNSLNALDQLKAEIAEVEEEIGQLRKRVGRYLVRASSSGLVFNLQVHTNGQVIQPGAVLMQIVPADVALEAEIRVLPKDIGYVHVGQDVNVKVSSYEYSRFGFATGKLKRISAFSIIDERGEPYFRAWVQLDQPYVGDVPGKYPLQPGMAVSAEILTGYKTLLTYLSAPIVNAISKGFRER